MKNVKTGFLLAVLVMAVSAVYAARTRHPVIIVEETDTATPLQAYTGQLSGEEMSSSSLGFSLFE